MSNRFDSQRDRIKALEQEIQAIKQAIVSQPLEIGRPTLPLNTLTFRIEEIFVALPIESTIEVTPMVLVTPLPAAPPSVRGTISYRGRLIPVLDPGQAFFERIKPLTTDRFLVIAKDNQRMYALVADQPEGVIRITESDLDSAAQLASIPKFVHFIANIDQQAVILLDPGRLLVENNLDSLEELLKEIQGGREKA